MSKRNLNQPKMLPTVLQAIADLREIRGSTTKKIIERVQHIVESKKLIPKPRNIVMQVQSALKHGMRAGIISEKSGKFKLVQIVPTSKTFLKKVTTGPKSNSAKKSVVGKSKKNKLSKKPRKYLRKAGGSYSSLGETTTVSSATRSRSYSSACTTSDYSSAYEAKKPIARKNKRKPKARKPSPKQKKEVAQCPEEKPVNSNMGQRQSQRMMMNPKDQDYDTLGQYILDDQPGNECNNPDCLCNLKQEPLDDVQVQYDDNMHYRDYLN